jgi:predicted TIM-barrel fold metal-dependent hydrolase
MRIHRIIDAHVHVIPLKMMNKGSMDRFVNDSAFNKNLYEAIETQPDKMVEALDRQGVEWANIISYSAKSVMGFGAELVEYVGKYCLNHPDKLKPVMSANPLTDEKPLELLEYYRSKYGARWIKLHPVHQLFKPNAYREEEGGLKSLERIYDYAENNGFPVTIHTGTSIFPLARIKFGDPVFLDDVAVDFPKLKIVMAHGGRPFWTDTAFFLLRRHSNLYLDISGIPPKNILNYFPRLREVWEKVVFGSDWPTPGVKSIKKNVEDLSTLNLSEEALKGILYLNIAKLL